MSIIGKTVISKFTGKKGIITGIKENKVFVSFEYGGEISIPINKLENTLMLDQETKDALQEELNKLHQATTPRTKSPKAKDEGTKNIVFKITYCDGGETETNYGFRGACSKNCRLFNQKHGRAWCNNDENLCCQLSNCTISQEEFNSKSKDFICYESRMLIDWKAYAGYDNAKNPPKPRNMMFSRYLEQMSAMLFRYGTTC